MTIPCSSGAIDQVAVTEAGVMTLEGHLDCAGPEAAFGYARYDGYGDGTIRVADLRSYGSSAPTLFAEVWQVGLSHEPFAVCVVTDYEVRAVCFTVAWDGPGTPVVVASLATDDPLVARSIMFVSDRDGSPVCGFC
ncbi:hypothetical protein Prum_004570 [Phytohabitans rumicis]|uniref:Uncharacterized protein n=1 Tax=Phytohabitans rumicis TaxID=1076125 RepID=A0A6V8L284_9ACTN|nr:hypothetical protein Prum_004570 [Phytohabitans rumicis]